MYKGGGYFAPNTQQISGTVVAADLGSGAVLSGAIASGQIGLNHLASGSVRSGAIASGQVGRYHLASGCVVDFFPCEQDMSGVVAVAWGSGGCAVVPAERASGLRLPAVGVVAGSFVSGDTVPVVRRGRVGDPGSGTVASGGRGLLYVGSGGLIVNQSGFMGGASSGAGPGGCAFASGLSGSLTQSVGVRVSGGIDVQIGEPRSGLISGLLGQY